MTKTKQNTMQAAAIDGFGGIETITLRTLPVPEVGPDEVLIRVESAGVWDVFEREGGFAPDVRNRAEVTLRDRLRRSGHDRRCRRESQPLQAGSLGFPEKGRRRIHDLGYSDWLIGPQPAATVSTTWPAAKR